MRGTKGAAATAAAGSWRVFLKPPLCCCCCWLLGVFSPEELAVLIGLLTDCPLALTLRLGTLI